MIKIKSSAALTIATELRLSNAALDIISQFGSDLFNVVK